MRREHIKQRIRKFGATGLLCVTVTATATFAFTLTLNYAGLFDFNHEHDEPSAWVLTVIVHGDTLATGVPVWSEPGDTVTTSDSNENRDRWIKLPGTHIGIWPKQEKKGK